MSEYADFLKPGDDGSYKYQNLNYYWNKEEFSAYFIKIDSEIIGFILSNKYPYIPDDCDISIQEFFVLKKYRGLGYGREAALEFFRLFPGKYFVAQLVNNRPAIEFWRSVYKRIGLDYEESEEKDSGIKILTQRFAI
jgi:predicted acetyltransferase